MPIFVVRIPQVETLEFWVTAETEEEALRRVDGGDAGDADHLEDYLVLRPHERAWEIENPDEPGQTRAVEREFDPSAGFDAEGVRLQHLDRAVELIQTPEFQALVDEGESWACDENGRIYFDLEDTCLMIAPDSAGGYFTATAGSALAFLQKDGEIMREGTFSSLEEAFSRVLETYFGGAPEAPRPGA